MTKISMQCHAMPLEIYSLLASALPPSATILVFVRGGQSCFRRISRDDFGGLDNGIQQSLRITNYDPIVDVESDSGFLRANENVFVVDVGANKKTELGETVIGGMFNDNGAWVRPIVNALKKKMKAGAKVRSKTTGAAGYMKGHWLSPGAIKFSEGGGTLRAFAGASEYMP